MMAQPSEHAGFERILEYLRQARGFDFTAYKRTTLVRRVRKRMQAVEIAEFDAYLDFLQVHPDEFTLLFNTILINVTSFFRDPDVWETMGQTVIPELVGERGGSLGSRGVLGRDAARRIARRRGIPRAREDLRNRCRRRSARRCAPRRV